MPKRRCHLLAAMNLLLNASFGGRIIQFHPLHSFVCYAMGMDQAHCDSKAGLFIHDMQTRILVLLRQSPPGQVTPYG